MADFNIAYQKTRKWEGGYAKLQGDSGGETMWGIARNFWGEHRDLRVFWNELDNYKKDISLTSKLNELCENNRLMVESCKDFYRKEFWYKIKGDYIKDQKVAENLFDFYVNAGKNAIKVAQRALGVADDGIFGNQSLQATNNAGRGFNNDLYEARVAYYNKLNKPQFIKGWLNRANDFK